MQKKQIRQNVREKNPNEGLTSSETLSGDADREDAGCSSNLTLRSEVRRFSNDLDRFIIPLLLPISPSSSASPSGMSSKDEK